MFEEYYQSTIHGNIKIKSYDISHFFSYYKKKYMEVFKINEKRFLRNKVFKENRGGLFIEISNTKEILAVFTLSKSENNFLELGDIIKIKFKFTRSTFSKALNIACKQSLKLLEKNGIYGYPNPLALQLEMEAGFKIHAYYKRKIYFTFLNINFLLPFRIYNKRMNFNIKYLANFPFSINKFNLIKTASKKLVFNIYKKSSIKKSFFKNINFGFIYEFEKSEDIGDPFIIFGNTNFPLDKIDFQFTDNSV
jgi:hypothetical protein